MNCKNRTFDCYSQAISTKGGKFLQLKGREQCSNLSCATESNFSVKYTVGHKNGATLWSWTFKFQR